QHYLVHGSGRLRRFGGSEPNRHQGSSQLFRRAIEQRRSLFGLETLGREMDSGTTGRNLPARDIPGRSKGFTLIEMMIVISMILILLGIAMPIYSHSIRRAREENLRKNLQTLNKAIFQYALDKQKAPQSLDDLKSAGYLD